MATFLEICKDVRAQAGIAGDGPSSVVGMTGIEADVVRWVEESYNEIQTLHENWNFLYSPVQFTLGAGFDTYPALTTHSLRQIAKDSFLRQIVGEDKNRLPFISFVKFKNSPYFLKEETGIPAMVTERPDGTLVFYPKADVSYEIYLEGYARPDIMVDNTDVPVFSTQYHDLIKLLALMKYGQFFNETGIYTTAEKNYELLLKKMRFSELPRDSIITRPFA